VNLHEKWERYRRHKPKSKLNLKQIEAYARLLLPVLMAIELRPTLRCQTSDLTNLHFKLDEDRTKTAVAIEDDGYFGQTDSETDKVK